jgi:DNA excision repair protein ERCC-2
MSITVKVSVRALVEYVYRSGSIDDGFRTLTTLQEGTKVHQLVQQDYEEHDRKEVPMEGGISFEELHIVMDGRCDGLLLLDGALTVEEIKSTRGELAFIEEDSYPVHWAQAQCYAFMHAREEGLERMQVRLTYVQVDTQERKHYLRTYTLTELEAVMRHLAAGYAPYARLQLRHAEQRGSSCRELRFPFDAYRQGQRKLAGAVYKSIADRQRLFAKAPTGTGKTISTLFPAVKAIGEGELQRFYYLTAKTITRTAAEEAFERMSSQGLHLWSATITAKEKICFQEELRCRKEHCEFADGYYDRINEAVLDVLTQETRLTREVFERYARKHRVCPFEFSLDTAYLADAVICDYNYIFDPRVSLKRQYEEQKRETALLVDEAHNLVDRGRDMFSAELSKAPFLQLSREHKRSLPSLAAAAKAVNDFFLSLRKSYPSDQRSVVQEACPEALLPHVEAFAAEAEKTLAGMPPGGGETAQLLLDTYFAAQSFLRIAGYYSEAYITYAELGKSDVRLKLLCLDPSGLLRQMTKGYRSQVFFSATLSPLPYFREMLGGEADDYVMSIPSPFRKEQLDVRLLPVSTRYRDRAATKGIIAAALHQLLQEHSGNVLVFFPSYEYMREVLETWMEAEAPQRIRILVQQSGMSEEEREAFLASFQSDDERSAVGFAVMGGIFSEGIDLTGDRLTGVVVVGVGLPQVGLEREIMKEYFDRTGRNGFDYAYVYPGMNKVLQAGGRLIRTEKDRGTLLLVDDRFLQAKYRQLLPEEWKPAKELSVTRGK